MSNKDTLYSQENSNIEIRGIERVSPTNREHVRIFDNFTLWLSANLVISTVTLGSLGINVFKLEFWLGVISIFIFNILGTLPVAFFSTLGPKLGLRQMTISRFSFGWLGAMIMALFNVVSCIGWSVVNVIVGGQLIDALSVGTIPKWVGIVIIAALTTLVSIYGYKYVHLYERYAWLPMLFLFSLVFFVSAPNFKTIPPSTIGVVQSSKFMSFGATIYGFATGWSSYAADYNVKQPEDTPPQRIFWLTFLGVFIPCVSLEILGLALATVPTLQGKSGGELIGATVSSLGSFGIFIQVLLALSIVANNIPNDYSFALSIQLLGYRFQRVKRAVWTMIGSFIYVVLALMAANNFEKTLENFLSLIAYWLGPWSIILVLEHFVFRGGRYNADDWNNKSKLPSGWAAIISLIIGLIGVYLGVVQEDFVGLIAGLFNPPFGMNIGFELGIIFTFSAYLFLRWIEIKVSQR